MLGWLLGLCAQANIYSWLACYWIQINVCTNWQMMKPTGFFDLPKHPMAHAVSLLRPWQYPVPPTQGPDIVLWPEWLYSLQTTSDLLFGAAGIVVYTSGVTYAVGILNNSPFARLSDLWGHRSPEVNCTCYQWHNELQVPYKPQLTTNLALNVSSPCTGSATSTSESVSPLGMLKHEMHTVGRVSILQWYWVDPLKKQFQVK